MSVAEYYQRTCRRNRMMGLVEIIIGLCLGVMVVVNRDARMALYLVLAAVVIAIGIYMLFFYKKYFEFNLRKSVEQEYGANPYFQEEIRLRFFSNSFTEETGEGEKTVDYGAVASLYQYKELVVLSMEKGSSVILPARLFPQADPQPFLDFIKDKMEEEKYGPETSCEQPDAAADDADDMNDMDDAD